jgi:nucleoside-diphosphate-sugar epimerase
MKIYRNSQLRGRRFVFDSDILERLTGSAWFSSAKIEARLGFKPEWDLEKAMPAMVAELHASLYPR